MALLLCLILSFTTSISSVAATSSSQQCTFKDAANNLYDYSSLAKDQYWEVKESSTDSGLFSVAYIFNLCGPQPKCQNQPGAFEALDVLGQLTDSCDLLGSPEQSEISVLQDYKGLKIQYKNGAVCQASENSVDVGKPKKIRFVVYCDAKVKGDQIWKITPVNQFDVTSCNVELTIRHPAGCYQGMFSSGRIGSFLGWIIFFFILYCVLGVVYNYKQNGISGVEAIPNIDFWRRVGDQAQFGMKQLIVKINNLSGGRFGSGGGGYSSSSSQLKGSGAGYSQI